MALVRAVDWSFGWAEHGALKHAMALCSMLWCLPCSCAYGLTSAVLLAKAIDEVGLGRV